MSRPAKGQGVSTGLSGEDLALWQRVTGTVKPIVQARSGVATPAAAPATPVAKPAPKIKPAGPGPAPPARPILAKPAPLADRQGEKRVRRGNLDIVGKLDLHGLTQDGASAAVAGFLARVRGEGGGVVLIVTGKGGRLKGGETTPGILRQRLPDWLASPDLRPLVAGVAEAHRRHGGGGALYVFVRRPG